MSFYYYYIEKSRFRYIAKTNKVHKLCPIHHAGRIDDDVETGQTILILMNFFYRRSFILFFSNIKPVRLYV